MARTKRTIERLGKAGPGSFHGIAPIHAGYRIKPEAIHGLGRL